MIGVIIAVVFIVLKLTGVIGWSWWWVLSPLWIGLVISVIMSTVGVAAAGVFSLAGFISRRRERKRSNDNYDRENVIQKEYLLEQQGGKAIELRKVSNACGTASIVLAIIGCFWWPFVLGIVAVILAVIQWRRHISKRSIAGFVIGIVDIVIAVVSYTSGLMPSLF